MASLIRYIGAKKNAVEKSDAFRKFKTISLFFLGTASGVIIAFYIEALLPELQLDGVKSHVYEWWAQWLLVILGLLYILKHLEVQEVKENVHFYAKSWLEKTSALSQRELSTLLNRVSDRYERWEEIDRDWGSNVIKLGFVDFFPFTYTEQCGNKTYLIGNTVDILAEIDFFKEKLGIKKIECGGKCVSGVYVPSKENSNKILQQLEWQDLLSANLWRVNSLDLKAVDLVITPLYDHRMRRSNLMFCTPFFYADIGCYVNSQDEHFKSYCKGKLSWEDLLELLEGIGKEMNGEAIVEVIPGEMHEIICNKYLENWRSKDIPAAAGSTPDISSLILGVADLSDTGQKFVFAQRENVEEYIARETNSDDKSLKNLLKPGEFRLPSCMAVAHADDTFKRYINMHIFNFHHKKKNL